MIMRKNKSLFIISAILVLVHGGDAGFRFRDGGGGFGGRGDSYNQQQYRSAGYGQSYRSASSNIAGVPIGQDSAHSADQKPENDQIKTAGGLSAWGIVAIVVGVILLGTGGYYVFVFYPYICKKERNYDMIELTNVL